MNSILDFEIVQQLLVVVLSGQAGVGEVAVHLAPFPQPTVIEELELLGDDERDDSVCEAFLEHHQTPDSSVSVLERMDEFEPLMKVNDVLQ